MTHTHPSSALPPDAAHVDAVVIGAGAAGLFCAAQASARGATVLLIDHASAVAEKVRISGGGRANFTNQWLDVRAPHKHFVGDNPAFCRSALSRFTPQDFIALVDAHGIAHHEKHKGQLFCDHSAQDLIDMLLALCGRGPGQVSRWQPCRVTAVQALNASRTETSSSTSIPPSSSSSERETADTGIHPARYRVTTERGSVLATSVVVATGGLSIPKIGASDFGLRLAQQFGLRVLPTRPGLVPLTFDAQDWAPFVPLAGVALPVRISTVPAPASDAAPATNPAASAQAGTRPGKAGQDGKGAAAKRAGPVSFDEDLLFTHRGLSGPAVLQISSYWQPGTPLTLNLLPEVDLADELLRAKASSRKRVANELARWLPARLADAWCARDPVWQRAIDQVPDKALQQLAASLQRWQLTPSGTEGYRKAEVTLGGVDTRELSQQTLEAKSRPGLFFIGEVVDITGWLGGYNFQWAWASAHACAQALPLAGDVPAQG
ncbi:NAD(P)/FAD-dependent oxidoreductase [Comamonas serinivorans]|uniref:NAD(P)/FAD-dependent oxidoreductase n=1 Tax=Comamonas serinivorans TaxID=1082851 RepID=UPI001F1A6064|nr:NAD(P)/FAD-dependent oxidoreductase [Comamonas serinivorans]